jgi:hypothetical protein
METEQSSDKRFYPRYLIRVPFRMTGLTSLGENVDTEIEVVDISLDGLGFTSTRQFNDGEILYVTLQGRAQSSDVNMQILWRDGPRGRYGARILSILDLTAEA